MELDLLLKPKTLADAIRHFAASDVSLLILDKLRWPDGVQCPTCGRGNPRFILTRGVWECRIKHVKRRFSAKTGTIFEDSPLRLDKWFTAIWMVANCENGISSYELHRSIGVTQKSAWFMLLRIGLAMPTGSFLKEPSDPEADETYIAGVAKNPHPQEQAIKGIGESGKGIMMGARGTRAEKNKVRDKRIINTTNEVPPTEVKASADRGLRLFTDAHSSYRGLAPEFPQDGVDPFHFGPVSGRKSIPILWAW